MFHWQDALPASGLANYGMTVGGPHPALQDAEFMAWIHAAADRARKSRRKR
jgi:hypothetical protein